jgi:AAA domain/DnaB-like helicase N terminal domain
MSSTFPDLEGRQQAAGIEAEARLLALGFANLAALDRVVGRVLPRHFADELHRRVWRTLTEARQAGEREIDVLTVHQRLGGDADLLPALVEIEQQSPGVAVTADRVQSLAGTVLTLAQRREQEAALNAAAVIAFDHERPAAQRLEEARKLLEQVEQAQAQRFAVVPVAGLHEQEAPVFVWDGLIPVGHVTLWGAHGGTGKSLMALMLAVSVAQGLPLFNVPTMPGRVVFFSGEDDGGLLRHRLGFICEGLGIDPADLEGKLFLVDATAHDPVLYAQQDRSKGGTTPTYEALRAYIRETEPALVILDNASDVYAGSEIDRPSVRAFMRHAALLGRGVGAAVLLLAHVDKGTSRNAQPKNTEGYSGSTAWSNSARSRLFMARADDGAITLEHQKSNLGKLRGPIRLFWPEGGLPQVDEAFGPVVQGIADRAHEKALLKLVHEFTQRGEFVTTATTSRTHAAKLLRHEPTYPRLKDSEVFDLLRRCERSGYLERTLFKGPDRKERERWSVTATGASFAGIAATAATAAT